MSTVDRAESTLVRVACDRYAPSYLWNCTLYTTVEPCAMCAGAQYWANVGRLVYDVSERQLLALTGNHGENPTLDGPCRYVFDHGQKPIQVGGPIAAVEAEIVALHSGFWRERSRRWGLILNFGVRGGGVMPPRSTPWADVSGLAHRWFPRGAIADFFRQTGPGQLFKVVF